MMPLNLRSSVQLISILYWRAIAFGWATICEQSIFRTRLSLLNMIRIREKRESLALTVDLTEARKWPQKEIHFSKSDLDLYAGKTGEFEGLKWGLLQTNYRYVLCKLHLRNCKICTWNIQLLSLTDYFPQVWNMLSCGPTFELKILSKHIVFKWKWLPLAENKYLEKCDRCLI